MKQVNLLVFRNLYLEADSTGTTTRISHMISPPIEVHGNTVVGAGVIRNSSGLLSTAPLIIDFLGATPPAGPRVIASTLLTPPSGEPVEFDLSANTGWVSPILYVRATLSTPLIGTSRLVLDLGVGMSSQ